MTLPISRFTISATLGILSPLGIWACAGKPDLAPQSAHVSSKPPAQLDQASAEQQPEGQPPADSGRFHIYVNEEPLVTIDYTLDASGEYRGTAVMSFSGQSVTMKVAINTGEAPDKGRQWQHVSLETPQGPVTVERREGNAVVTAEGKSATVALTPQTVLFENFSPALLGTLLHAYDRNRGGKQSISTLILPQTVQDVTVVAQGTVQRALKGRDMEFVRYSVTMAGIELDVWADASGLIYLAGIPSQHAAYVREGWEALRTAQADDASLLSKPTFEVLVDKNVAVPMRDGVALATDIYRPKTDDKVPLILVRTPYKKELSELQARYYARRGYAFAVQDVRGRFASPGTWEPFVHEGDDGHDAIEWLATRPYTNGKVGMIGASYLGWVQWWAASRKPPHLVTIVPNVAPPDPFFNIPYEYGTFFLLGAIWWADVLESEATADISGTAMHNLGKKRYGELLRALPVIELDKAVLGKENRYWRTWIAHPTNDAYWQPANFLDRLADVRIPVFHQSGWFDGDGIGSKLNYQRMAQHGHPHQKLVLGPWGHTDEATRQIGDRDFGPTAIVDLQRAYLRWFDYWLKGMDNGIVKEPLVKLFVMGENRWLEGNTYPLEVTRWDSWYLASDGSANTGRGNGRLSRNKPKGAPSDTYVYDPGDPTPHPDYYEPPEQAPGSVVSRDELDKASREHHLKITEERRDILVYQTEPFAEPYTMAGPISAVLYASSTGRDTDWFVRLMEVDAEGKVFPLVQGTIRARFRRSMSKPELLQPGKVYEYTIDMWQTGISIPKGHRLRVEIASAAFPMYSRNLNTGGHNETETKHVPATQVIHHSARYPSHIRLPAIPR